jgi:hypothetical protein
LDDLYLKSEQGQEIFLFSKMSRLALGPIQPLIQWAWGALSSGVKQVGHEADHSHPSAARDKEWSYAATPYICLHSVFRKYFFYLYF